MELKNAVAICLISMFSATLVLLIARSLDLQTASRLEPQLEKIVDELKLIRKSGTIAASFEGEDTNEAVDDGLMVYYFHSKARCPTCRSIERQSRETVLSKFASELESGQIVWKILNYEKPAVEELTKQFEIQMPVVVLARMKDGQIDDWKRLDKVWALVGDQQAFADYLQAEIRTIQSSKSPEIPMPYVSPLPLPIPDQAN